MNIPLTPIRFLRYARQQFPNKTAVVCRDQRFTYTQLAERAGRLAGALKSMGAAPGDRVAFLSTNCHHLLEAYYGVLEAGCVLLPLNVRVTPAEMVYVLNDAGARFLFVDSQFLRLVDGFCQEVLSVENFVLLDGAVVPACDTPVEAVAGRSVGTVEGLARDGRPHPVQQAILDRQAAQCGFCISGITVRAAALLEQTPAPDAAAVAEALDRNLCRCGAQRRIIDAVVAAGRAAGDGAP